VIFMSDKLISMTPKIQAYIQAHSLRETDVLKKLREDTHKMSTGHMQISPEQGQFFQLLIQILGARKTLDIGVFTGYSALCVASVLPPEGQVIGCDINSEWTKMAKRFWDMAGVSHKIDLRLQEAILTLDQLLRAGEGGTFDFIFIDADKKNYLTYYEKSLALLRLGGLIAIDNTLWSGRVADASDQDLITGCMRQLNDYLHYDSRVTLSLLPVGDGLTLVRKT